MALPSYSGEESRDDTWLSRVASCLSPIFMLVLWRKRYMVSLLIGGLGEKRKLCLFMPGSLCGHALDIGKQRYLCNNGRHRQRKSTSSFRLQRTPSFFLVSVVVFQMRSCKLFPTWCSNQAYGKAALGVLVFTCV
jgi:hypothetical protein